MNGYAFSVQTINATASQYRLINWTTQGTDTNFTNRISNNVSTTLSLSADTAWDWNQGVAIWTRTYRVASARQGTALTAVNLKTGQVMWDFVTPDYMYNPICNDIDHGKLALLTALGHYNFYDEFSGKLLFKSDSFPYPWDQPGFGAYDSTSAYGMLFRNAYSAIYAVSWDTGKIVWRYESPNNPYETPYHDENGTTVSSWNGVFWAADGKIYASNTEHTPTQPIARGWKLHCVNATTGEGIWNITGSMTIGPIVDGYMTGSNSYDGYTYVFGKGQSATTVSAPLTAVTQGQSVVIMGTVTDQSPAQPGTACVSKESMATYMEYLHMQKPIPSGYIVKGVPVSVDAVDPNGNYVHIADVTSDVSGTFSYMWTPELAGKYSVTATFMGDVSYGSSWAETAVGVTQAPQATATPTATPAQQSSTDMYLAGSTIAIIIAIAIVGLLILRKRP
jgi:hypothetical protein